MTALTARPERFRRWLVVLAAAGAVGPRARIREMPPPAAPSPGADASAGLGAGRFVHFCNGEKTIDFNAV